MEYIFIYLLQISVIAENAAIALLVVFFICLVFWGIFVSMVTYAVYDDEKKNAYRNSKWIKKVGVKSLILSVILFIIPTKQTLLLFGGTYYGKRAVNAVVTNSKIEKVNTIIELELDKRIKELKAN